MKKFALLTLIFAASTAVSSFAADAVAGKEKAIAACASCHGSETSSGVFFMLQLGGRNADKLAVKTNKYRTGKLFNPLMTMSVWRMSESDIADISAYYQSMGKPYLTAPFIKIKGDDDAAVQMAASSTLAPTY